MTILKRTSKFGGIASVRCSTWHIRTLGSYPARTYLFTSRAFPVTLSDHGRNGPYSVPNKTQIKMYSTKFRLDIPRKVSSISAGQFRCPNLYMETVTFL